GALPALLGPARALLARSRRDPHVAEDAAVIGVGVDGGAQGGVEGEAVGRRRLGRSGGRIRGPGPVGRPSGRCRRRWRWSWRLLAGLARRLLPALGGLLDVLGH